MLRMHSGHARRSQVDQDEGIVQGIPPRSSDALRPTTGGAETRDFPEDRGSVCQKSYVGDPSFDSVAVRTCNMRSECIQDVLGGIRLTQVDSG